MRNVNFVWDFLKIWINIICQDVQKCTFILNFYITTWYGDFIWCTFYVIYNIYSYRPIRGKKLKHTSSLFMFGSNCCVRRDRCSTSNCRNMSVFSIPVIIPSYALFRHLRTSRSTQSIITVSGWALGSGWTMTGWAMPAGRAARRLPSWWLTTSPWRPTRSSGRPAAAITSPASWSESAYQISAKPQII